MEEGVRIHFYPHPPHTRYHTGVAAFYPPVAAPKHGVNAEDHLLSIRTEQPSQLVPEDRNDDHIIGMEPTRRRRRLRRGRTIMSPSVCKTFVCIQIVAAGLICLVWYLG